jgi:serine/threonine-protein kinase
MSALAERYEIIRVLGTGGMAEVSLARILGPSNFEKVVVVKRILPHLASNADFVALFEREARLSAMLDHPNIVQVLDFGTDEGRPFLVMELVDGGSLRELLSGLQQRDERSDLRLLGKVFSQAAQGLAAAHTAVDPRSRAPLNLVHRDVSPDNLLLSRTGAVKVSDFGVARAMAEVSVTAPEIVRGKIAYLSPEQLYGQEVTAAADQWALGVSLYEAIVGRRPFDGATEGATMYAISNGLFQPVRSCRSDCPADLAMIVERCLAPQSADRWPDCHEVAIALDRCVQASGGPITSSMLGSWVDRVLGANAEAAARPPLLPEISSAQALRERVARQMGEGAAPLLPSAQAPGENLARQAPLLPEISSAQTLRENLARQVAEGAAPLLAEVSRAQALPENLAARFASALPTPVAGAARGAAADADDLRGAAAADPRGQPSAWEARFAPRPERPAGALQEGEGAGEDPGRPGVGAAAQAQPREGSAEEVLARAAGEHARPGRRWGLALLAVLGLLAAGSAVAFGLPALQAARAGNPTLVVSAQPKGATVSIDGEAVGVAPWAGDLRGGTGHEVVVSLRGYAPWQASLDAGVSGSFEVQLRRRRPGERE